MSYKNLEIVSLERVPAEAYSEENVKLLEKAKKENTADAYMELGLSFAASGLFREAVDAYSKGLALDPFKGILYRHRGHRFLSCYRFMDALADFTMAVRMIPENWDAWYHLGLTRFLLRDYEGAAEAYASCLKVCRDERDLVAVSDWYWMTCKRLGREDVCEEILSRIHDGMDGGDSVEYYYRLQMYQGKLKPEDVLPQDLSTVTPLGIATRGFGVANYYNILGDHERAEEIFALILESGREDMYNAFGYMATLAEKGMIQSM